LRKPDQFSILSVRKRAFVKNVEDAVVKVITYF